MTSSPVLLLLLLPLLHLPPPSTAVTWDLSHTHKPTTFTFGDQSKYNRVINVKGDYGQAKVFVDAGSLTMAEHSGTHIDAPNHFIEGAMTLDQVTVDMTVATGVHIDCSQEVIENITYVMPLQKLLSWEEEHGAIPQRAAVLINFGWSKHFENETAYAGPDGQFYFPTISEEAGEWLLKKRDIKMLGTDTLSCDSMNPKDGELFKNHILLLGNNRILVENIKYPDDLPARYFRFYAVPVKYEGGTGTQVRAFAVGELSDGNGARAVTHWGLPTFVVVALFVMKCVR